ncbi:MAG: glycosyltransferase family 4 protein [Maricaulaceae bacterium]
MVALLAAALTAFVIAALGARTMIAVGVMDMPRDRSAHAAPVPRGAGLGVAAGVGAALWGYAVVMADLGGLGGSIGAALAIAAGFAVVGLADDVLDLNAKAKFAIAAGLSLLGAAMIGPVAALPLTEALGAPLPGVFGLLGTALWIFVAANGVNFMDGANGLVTGAMVSASAALGLAAAFQGLDAVACAAFVLAAGLAGFAPFNAFKPRAFLGDTGALFIGALFAGLTLAYVRAAPPGAVYVGPIAMFPLLADVLLTLLWRARAGRNLLSPHTDHIYQRWLIAKASHGFVALRVLGLSAVCGGLAVAASVSAPWVGALVLAGLAIVALLSDRALRARGCAG